jgi:hypothetical protein
MGVMPLRTRPQRPLALVVGRLHIAALQEHEQLAAAVESNRVAQLAALQVGASSDLFVLSIGRDGNSPVARRRDCRHSR